MRACMCTGISATCQTPVAGQQQRLDGVGQVGARVGVGEAHHRLTAEGPEAAGGVDHGGAERRLTRREQQLHPDPADPPDLVARLEPRSHDQVGGAVRDQVDQPLGVGRVVLAVGVELDRDR